MEKETDSLGLYLKDISKFLFLSAGEEAEITGKIIEIREKINVMENKKRNKTDDQALETLKNELSRYKNIMIHSNLRLVVSIAKKYRYCGLSLSDLINEGNIGLMTAVDKFDPKRGCRFITYAVYWIKQSIMNGIIEKGRDIRMPGSVINLIRKYKAASEHLSQELGRELNEKELSEYLNLSESRMTDIINMSQTTFSLNSSGDDGESLNLEDIITDETYPDPFDCLYSESINERVQDLLAKLCEKERKILQLRFGLAGERAATLDEVGKHLKISRERVRQIQHKAICKLRKFREYAAAV